MLETLFPNYKPLSITELEAAIEVARSTRTDKLIIFVNSNEVENVIDEVKSNGIIDYVFIYESEYVEKGKIYAVRTAPDIAEFMRRFELAQKHIVLSSSFECVFQRDCHLAKREIGTKDKIKAIKDRIKRSRNYLEQKSLQRELGELEREQRRRRGR